MGGTPTSRATPNLEIFTILPGDTTSPNHMGFFGALGAPSSPVVVGTWQNRTHRTNRNGSDLGQMINVKFTGVGTAEVSGVSTLVTGHTIDTIPQNSGTLLLRFAEPNNINVQTQNGIFRIVALNASSGVADPTIPPSESNILVHAAQLKDNYGFAGNIGWSRITSSGLNLADQITLMTVHDYHVIVSASPQIAGTQINFGFYTSIEYL